MSPTFDELMANTQNQLQPEKLFDMIPHNESTSQEAEEMIETAKDNVAKNNGYSLFEIETGGWTRFDRMYDQSGKSRRIEIISEVAIEYARLYHTSKLREAEEVSHENVCNWLTSLGETNKSDGQMNTNVYWALKTFHWLTDKLSPKIAAMKERIGELTLLASERALLIDTQSKDVSYYSSGVRTLTTQLAQLQAENTNLRGTLKLFTDACREALASLPEEKGEKE